MKEVQPLYEIPLGFPNQIDLHSEGEDVVPDKHRRRHDYGKNELNLSCFSNGRTDHQSSSNWTINQWYYEAQAQFEENPLSPISKHANR